MCHVRDQHVLTYLMTSLSRDVMIYDNNLE
jgi:hypothetical protein